MNIPNRLKYDIDDSILRYANVSVLTEFYNIMQRVAVEFNAANPNEEKTIELFIRLKRANTYLENMKRCGVDGDRTSITKDGGEMIIDPFLPYMTLDELIRIQTTIISGLGNICTQLAAPAYGQKRFDIIKRFQQAIFAIEQQIQTQLYTTIWKR